MDRGRFTLLLVLTAAAVAVLSFAAALAVLDDDGADPPPSAATDTDDTSTETSATPASTTTTAAVTTGELPSPSYVVVISSEGDESFAAGVATEVAAKGYSSGVLRSDDYPSLNPGFWVAYAGPFGTLDEAAAKLEPLAADGWGDAYVRCAGSRADCRARSDGGGDGDDDD